MHSGRGNDRPVAAKRLAGGYHRQPATPGRFGLSMFIKTVVQSWNGPMLLGYLEKEIGADGLRDILSMAGKTGLGGYPKGK